jgi:hypothetical protein
MISLFSHLKILAKRLMILSYTMEEIYKIFDALADFLKKSEDNYFEIKNSIPLIFTEEGHKEIKKSLSEFPNVYSVGSAGLKDVSFLYLLGQFLTYLVMKIYSLEAQMPKHEFDEIKKPLEELIHLWSPGSTRLNADLLYSRYRGEPQKSTIGALIPLLEKSSEITQKLSPIVKI